MADAIDLVTLAACASPIVLAIAWRARGVSAIVWVAALLPGAFAVLGAAWATLHLPLRALHADTFSVVCGIVALVTCFGVGCIAFALRGWLERALARPAFTLPGLLATMMLLAMAAAASFIALRKPGPTPSHFLERLERIGVLSDEQGPGEISGRGVQIAGPKFTPPPVTTSPDPSTKPPPQCAFDVTNAGRAISKETRGVPIDRASSSCPPIVFYVDRERQDVFFDAPEGQAAWVGAKLDWRDATPLAFADELSPPRGWIALGFGGAALAIVSMIAAAPRLSRRRRAIDDAIDAAHEGGGRVRLGGENEPTTIPAAAGLPAGPILVYGLGPAVEGGYRSASVTRHASRVEATTRAAAKVELVKSVAMAFIAPVAILAHAAAPLFACALAGMI